MLIRFCYSAYWLLVMLCRLLVVRLTNRKLRIYLAVPYTGSDKYSMDEVEHIVSSVAGSLMEYYVVFSPITHGHAIASTGYVSDRSWEFWREQCLPYIDMADKMYILCLPGWDTSVGVLAEKEIAIRQHKEIAYIGEEL